MKNNIGLQAPEKKKERKKKKKKKNLGFHLSAFFMV